MPPTDAHVWLYLRAATGSCTRRAPRERRRLLDRHPGRPGFPGRVLRQQQCGRRSGVGDLGGGLRLALAIGTIRRPARALTTSANSVARVAPRRAAHLLRHHLCPRLFPRPRLGHGADRRAVAERRHQFPSVLEELHYERADAFHDGADLPRVGSLLPRPARPHALASTTAMASATTTPTDCGHCQWCPESDLVTWMEGVAQFLSRINTDHIEDVQDRFRPVHKGMEHLIDDSSCDWSRGTSRTSSAARCGTWSISTAAPRPWDLHQDVLGRLLYDRSAWTRTTS